jgi:hypothetical protein
MDARELLEGAGMDPLEVVDVHSDAILWRDQTGAFKTTFVVVEAHDTRQLTTRDGFAATPED